MMAIKTIAIAAVAALVHTATQAAYMSGNDMLERLRDRSATVERSVATGYLIGLHDAYNKVTHCSPPNVTVGQLIDMTVDWLDRNPKTRHQPASSHVLVMLMTTWPCKKDGDV